MLLTFVALNTLPTAVFDAVISTVFSPVSLTLSPAFFVVYEISLIVNAFPVVLKMNVTSLSTGAFSTIAPFAFASVMLASLPNVTVVPLEIVNAVSLSPSTVKLYEPVNVPSVGIASRAETLESSTFTSFKTVCFVNVSPLTCTAILFATPVT